ncbi:hypothetical protein A5787_09505 [Mycobacterium sp. 852002-50816_SCH5313054-b]|uniref:hypothetical protein n=1 Tax=Mycobacterium sp. 852002-50816_SCH5313054-b TaxID=1834092 RepID=UPI0007FFFF71|nr:hypothetical protein [Mycobacterium sp. 852002-50816_SCH5313054-b]OBF48915.1 hypothetical protein A5787_09505 [Mycobacterium sp. 852002-50816_SCH5313054-b]
MKATTIAAAAKAVTVAVLAGAVAFGVAAPASAASEVMYGDPVAAAEYWHEQRYDDCVLMASADVIGQLTGAAPSERAIIAKAHSTPSVVSAGPIYTKPADPVNPSSGGGASLADVPTLLAQYRVTAVVIDRDDTARSGIRPGIAGLKQALGGGHKVIVSLNGELIWHQPVEEKDKFGNPLSDHAVVVTGVDATHGIVHLNDSGTSEGRDEQIPLPLFVQSWETSNELMVVTL